MIQYMKWKNHLKFVPEQSRSLIEEIWNYSSDDFPQHRWLWIHWLQILVQDFVANITKHGIGLIWFSGLPWVGKSSKVGCIQAASERALWFTEPEEFITYQQPDGKVIEVWWYFCKKASAIITTLHADHFFGALWPDRRDWMLENTESCRNLWWDPKSAFQFVRAMTKWQPTNIKIYTWSVDEKTQKEPQGRIEIRNPNITNPTKVIIVEWVNVAEWVQKITRKTSIKTLNILYNTSFVDSLIRVLRRDKKNKWYSFQTTIDDRLREYYYIFELYIKPALNDPATILLNKKRAVPPFTISEKEEIIDAINTSQKRWIHDDRLSQETKDFINIFCDSLLQRFSEMKYLTQDEIDLWNMKKLLKKEQKKYTMRKNHQHPDGKTKQQLRRQIKETKKWIKETKKRIKSTK